MHEMGARIREIRIRKNLTLNDLARMTGVTASLISQIENRKSNPSVPTLYAISRALDVPIGAFFDDPSTPDNLVIRKNDRSVVHTANGITYYLLNKEISESPIEVLWGEYERGSSTGQFITHEGVECGTVLSGKLEVAFEDNRHVLNAGDSITLSSSKPHMVTNLSDDLTTAIWINSPPSF